MTAHAHHWHLKHYEHCVSRGTCQCGAIRFFADDLGKDVLKRVEEINRAQGKEGFIDMIDTNKVEEKPVAALPSVPPRPSSRFDMKRYYEDNKEAILHDLETLGVKAMQERWKISHATWRCKSNGRVTGMAVRWGIVSPDDIPTRRKGVRRESSPETPPVTINASDRSLPAFPEFDKSWPEIVQIRWLDTYRELARSK